MRRRSKWAIDPRDSARPVPWGRRLPWILLLPLCAGLQWLGARQPQVSEAYGGFFFPLISRGLGTATGWVPFSIAEILLIGLALATLAVFLRGLRRLVRRERRVRAVLAGALANLLALAGAAYGAETLLWGLNYDRSSWLERSGWDGSPVRPEELRELAAELVERANTARLEVDETADGVMRLGGTQRRTLARARLGFERARQLHELLAPGYAGRAKGLLVLSGAMSRLGLGGVYVPFTGEPTVNLELPDPALPFSTCHEISHQMGFAREEEANFVGYLACSVHPDDEFRYSTELAALGYVLGALREADPAQHAALAARLSEGVRRDRDAVREFWARHESRLSEAAIRVNDAYLRSHGQEQGAASYGLMVDLLVAARRRDADR